MSWRCLPLQITLDVSWRKFVEVSLLEHLRERRQPALNVLERPTVPVERSGCDSESPTRRFGGIVWNVSFTITVILERPLTGCIVGMSISESDELQSLGFDRFEVNRAVIRLSEALLGAGARLAFGHDWRPGGVMEAVAELAVRYLNAAPVVSEPPQAPILNRVAPPDVPFLDPDREPQNEAENLSDPAQILRTRLRGIVDAQQVAVPPAFLEGPDARQRALTWLRQELAQICDARVCLGGKLANFSGRMPGVIEEAVYTVAVRGPLYVSEIFGGAAKTLANALDRGPGAIFDFVPVQDESWKRWNFAPGDSPVSNGLESDENRRLRSSKLVEVCIELILHGLIRWWQEHRGRVLNERRERGWTY
jgi:hypothetical protein